MYGKVHAKKAITVAKKRNIDVETILPNDIEIISTGIPTWRA